ncbi:MAG TPA: hypothetical protein VGK00_05760 [Anaerolineales bacterium]|jgi:hypothetical protein
MAYLTIFSAPKGFSDPHIATIQRNAIASWTRIPNTAVILLGDEPGLAEAARELGVTHIQDVPRSPSGAPLMDTMFRLAREKSPSPLYCIVNADIILFPGLVETATQVAARNSKFVLLGRRWDMDINEPLDFSGDWPTRLMARVKIEGKLHRPAGSDYFIFHKSCYQDIPAFTIGRAGWDNWMIYHARKSGFPVIDGSMDITIIHQNHDYSHLPNGEPHYDHPETEENIRLAGGRPMTRFTLLDADHLLVKGQIVRQEMDSLHLWRQIEAWPLLVLNSQGLSNLLWRLHKWLVND